jgi:carbonic anhydrase/acetyltransferase-like protein (isoleucine patch superfamily)
MAGDRPSIVSFRGRSPQIHDSAFIAPGVRIIGDVEIGEDASIWYNCVLRGDINRIVVGARSNLQDGTIVHVEAPRDDPRGLPTLIGDDVLVGHQAILHGCVLEDRAFVGMGSVVMDGARVSSGAMLAAGALLAPGKTVTAGQLWAGRPARPMRDLSEAELAAMLEQTRHYVDNARLHKAEMQ